jgi:transcriptional regulator with XRE-family HTH domain
MSPRFIVDLRNVRLYNIDMPRAQDLDFAADLGNAIIARRDWLAISQADLAERLDVSPTQMSRYERGIDQISALQLARIATALGTTPNDLTGYQEMSDEAKDMIGELFRIFADTDIAAAIHAMRSLKKQDRSRARKVMETFVEGIIA